MKNGLLSLLLIVASCSIDPSAVKPEDVARSEGSDLLEFRADYTILGSDGKSRIIIRVLAHQFDESCRLTERREVYTENNFPLSVERSVYAYNNSGLLATQKQYKSYNEQPERLISQAAYTYDPQGRLISQNAPGANWRFEYIDDKKQVNRYGCDNSGTNCTLSTSTVDGKRTYPESGDYTGGYVSSSPTPYGNTQYTTVDAKGNEVLIEVYNEYKKKTLLEKIVQTYDAHPAIPLAVNETDFKGHPNDYAVRLGNNMLQSDYYTYDPATGAVRKHVRTVSQYTYNNLGYPSRVKTMEVDMLTRKLTGERTSITVRYGCGN